MRINNVFKVVVFICTLVLFNQVVFADFIVESGDIKTSTQSGSGTVESGGSIRTMGDYTYGITSVGCPCTKITNLGVVNTTGNSAVGVYVDAVAVSAIVRNVGTLATSGSESEAIYSEAADLKVTNAGKISSKGNNATGIYSKGANSVIKNLAGGTIITLGDNSYGVFTSSSNNSVSNSHIIQTSGNMSHGIYSSIGDHDYIYNDGDVITKGNEAIGILSKGDNANIKNKKSGIISTIGEKSHGICVTGEDSVVNNAGNIKTLGKEAYGLCVLTGGTKAKITNSGTISADGVNAHGIYTSAAGVTINNYGKIDANNTGSYAIKGSEGDSLTINLYPDSNIIGKINTGGHNTDNDVVNVYGTNKSKILIVENAENINIASGVGVVKTGNLASTIIGPAGTKTIVVVDPTVFSTQIAEANALGLSIQANLSQRLGAIKKDANTSAKIINSKTIRATKGKSALAAIADLGFSDKPSLWGKTFINNTSYNKNFAENVNIVAHSIKQKGFVLGYDKYSSNNNIIGIFGGMAQGSIDSTQSFDANTSNYFVGAYNQYTRDNINYVVSLIGGFNKHKTRRFMDNEKGVEVEAKASFNSKFLTPTLRVYSTHEINDKFELRPSLSISRNLVWIDDIKETGSIANIKIKARKEDSTITRAKLELIYKNSNDVTISARIGANIQKTNRDYLNLNVAGQDAMVKHGDYNNVKSAFIGARASLVKGNDTNLFIDFEHGKMQHKVGSYNRVNLGFKYAF